MRIFRITLNIEIPDDVVAKADPEPKPEPAVVITHTEPVFRCEVCGIEIPEKMHQYSMERTRKRGVAQSLCKNCCP